MRRLRRRLVPLLAPVLLAASAVACTAGDEAGGPATGSPAGTSAAAPAATIGWTRCPLPAGPDALVRAVTAGGDGAPWTAVGQEGGGAAEVRPAVWTSPDGCAWRRAPVRAATPDGERTGFTAVARRGRLVAALGRSYSRIHGNPRPTLWRSAGGAPLREVELPRELFGGESGISVDALVDGTDGLLAAGAYVAADRNVAVQLWRSPDGAGWDRLPPGREQVSSRTEQLLPRAAATGPGGSVVVGTAFQVRGGGRDSFDAAAWYAGRGQREWRRADLSGAGVAGQGDQRMVAVVPVGGGYVALAAVRSGGEFQLRSAVSPDGLGWSVGGPLPAAAGLPAADRPQATLAVVTGNVAAESVAAGSVVGGRAALWRSADGRDWRPEPVPAAAGTAASGVVLGAGGDRLVLIVQTPGGPRAHLGDLAR